MGEISLVGRSCHDLVYSAGFLHIFLHPYLSHPDVVTCHRLNSIEILFILKCRVCMG